MRRILLLPLLLSIAFLFILGCAGPPEGPPEGAPPGVPGEEPGEGEGIVPWYEIGEPTVPEDGGEEVPPPPENITENVTPEDITPENVTPEWVSDRIEDSKLDFVETPGAILYIYVIDVGYGDAILLKKGDLDILVDGGDGVHGQSVADFLSYIGVDDLEIVVATHPREKNIGGLPSVLEAFHVEELWDNNVTSKRDEYVRLMDAVNGKKIPVKHPSAGNSIEINGINITVLNPQKKRYASDPNPDPDSIALRIGNGNFCMLLMGDAEEGVQPVIMTSGIDLKCDVLLVPRHASGNAVSDLFLLNVVPSQAIISVGPNDMGYPNPTTITRLGLKGIEVYRTDLEGTVLVTTDGTVYNVQKYG